MSKLIDMQDKTIEITLTGQNFTAHQLFVEDWAQIEEKLKGTAITINTLLSGDVTIIGYRAVIEAAIGRPLPPKVELKDVFQAAGDILNLDASASEEIAPNSHAALVETEAK